MFNNKKYIAFFLVISFTYNLNGFNAFNAYANIPKPEIAAEAAILMDADSGEILFEKNINDKHYPASITKIMTALLVLERANLGSMVDFSNSATSNLESGAVNLRLTEGDRISVKDCLYGLMLYSANDVANGLAEHVSGSVAEFSRLMNKRALELGCRNTNFVNPNGLNSTEHYTTALDMAYISREAFNNPEFNKIISTKSYIFPKTKSFQNPRSITMGHKMIHKSDARYYEGVVGGKTGYTKKAGNTLVTLANKNGKRFVVVILKSRQTQYTDTKALLDYGYKLRGIGIDSNVQTIDSKAQGSSYGPGMSMNTNSVNNTNNNVKKDNPNKDNPNKDNNSNKENKVLKDNNSNKNIIAPNPSGITENVSISQGPGVSPAKTGWISENNIWYYIKADGRYAKGEILNINNYDYWFNDDASMAIGWKKDKNGDWYYLRDFGGMKKSSWLLYDGKWYYLDNNGKMLKDTKTPDGYIVDINGVWVN